MHRFPRILISLIVGGLAFVPVARALTAADLADISPRVDEAPAPVKTFAPDYPAALRKENVSGLVSLTVVVDEKGEVVAAEVAKATHDDFREPAVAAVKRWRFKPAILAGKPVKVKVTIPVRFSADS